MAASIVHWHNEWVSSEVLTVLDGIDPNALSLSFSTFQDIPGYYIEGFVAGRRYQITADSTGASLVTIHCYTGDNPFASFLFADGVGTGSFVAESSSMVVTINATDVAEPPTAVGTGTVTFIDLDDPGPIEPVTGGFRVGRIGFPITTPSASFVATLAHTLDLGPEDITQDYDGNWQDLWHGQWTGTGTVEGVTPSTTTGVIAHLEPGTYLITLDWAGVLLTGDPIHGVDPLPTPNIGMWVGPLAGFQGVSVPFGDQSRILSPTETATVTVTNPAYTELHIMTLNKKEDSTIYMPAGITVTIIRL